MINQRIYQQSCKLPFPLAALICYHLSTGTVTPKHVMLEGKSGLRSVLVSEGHKNHVLRKMLNSNHNILMTPFGLVEGSAQINTPTVKQTPDRQRVQFRGLHRESAIYTVTSRTMPNN